MKTNILPEVDNKDYMVEVEKQYKIDFCKREEIDELVEFIDTNWVKDHAFVKSRELIDWQHYDKQNNRYNFVIAKNRVSGEIHSILGFVPTYQFNAELETCDVWPCIWKVKEGTNVKGLGISLYKFLKDTLPVRSFCILGISEIALSIYKKWNFNTGKINQYYMVNFEKKDFQLIKGAQRDNSIQQANDKKLVELNEEEFLKLNLNAFDNVNRIPYKGKSYYIDRFFRHPIYQYTAYGILEEDKIISVLFTRDMNVDGNVCIRIVDFCGEIDTLYNMKANFQQLLISKDAEYVDFLNVGYDETELQKVGFIKKQSNSDVVVPNYFEPFLLKNVDLDYAWKTIDSIDKENTEILFFKADADQDRPNKIK